jgi:hypothetical protein
MTDYMPDYLGAHPKVRHPNLTLSSLLLHAQWWRRYGMHSTLGDSVLTVTPASGDGAVDDRNRRQRVEQRQHKEQDKAGLYALERQREVYEIGNRTEGVAGAKVSGGPCRHIWVGSVQHVGSR